MKDLEQQHQNLSIQKQQLHNQYQNVVGALQCIEQQMQSLKNQELEEAKKKAEAEHDKRVEQENEEKEVKKEAEK